MNKKLKKNFKNLPLMQDAPDTTRSYSGAPDSDNTLFSNETDSVLPSSVDEQEYLKAYAKKKAASKGIYIPLLGKKPAARQARTLSGLFIFFFLLTILLGGYAISQSDAEHNELSAPSSLQFNTARLSRSISAAITGEAAAFTEVKESYKEIDNSINNLQGNPGEVENIQENLGAPLGKDVEAIVKEQKMLVALASTVKAVHADVATILEQLDVLKSALAQRHASTNQALALGDITILILRIENTANIFLSTSFNLEDSSSLSQNVVSVDNLIKALAQGNQTLGIEPLPEQEQQALGKISTSFVQLKSKTDVLLSQAKTVQATRQAYAHILFVIQNTSADVMALSQHTNSGTSRTSGGVSWWHYGGIAISGLLTLLTAVGLVYVQLADTRRLQQRAEEENNNNQLAILRLMDELQNIADGDLTREATVTEDVTGAIADSVNNAMEEWRTLVGNVKATADKVLQTTDDVELTSNTLLDASSEQLNEIFNTGESVLSMAQRINAASYQAKESAIVAMRSRQAAEKGYKAAQDSIDGMNIIRDQIQETSKRIKRLGESSQEIGEITELISDITEQTNVLSLNAAIQAASAGEAGRGFSVVAEEVQRLAERSAEATKQISVLVKTIQTDTNDAVSAMERSTQGVVQGATLSDHAGQALEEINLVSRQLSELIQKISATTSEEAEQANLVAGNIQKILSVTESAAEGTRTTAQAVRELSKVAQELRTSIARFKIK